MLIHFAFRIATRSKSYGEVWVESPEADWSHWLRWLRNCDASAVSSLVALGLSTLWPVGWEKSCDSTEVQHYRKYLRLKDPVERPMWWHNDDALPQNPQNDKSGHRMLCSEREGIRGPTKIAVITGNSSFHTNHQPTHCFTMVSCSQAILSKDSTIPRHSDS